MTKAKHKIICLAVMALVTTLTSCSKESKKNDSDQHFFVRAVTPKTSELRENVYPVGACILLQLQAVNGSQSPIALKTSADVKFSKGGSLENGKESLQFDIYSSGTCDQKIEQSSLPAKESPSVSMADVYIKATGAGEANFAISYEAERATGKLFKTMKFEP